MLPAVSQTSLEDVIQTGASRILTSAGQLRATDGLATLAQLVGAANGRIVIMACGGINSQNVVHVVRTTLAQEVHSSAGTSNPSGGNGNHLSEGISESESGLPSAIFEKEVAKLVSLLEAECNERIP